jgi:hypothetical protein
VVSCTNGFQSSINYFIEPSVNVNWVFKLSRSRFVGVSVHFVDSVKVS